MEKQLATRGGLRLALYTAPIKRGLKRSGTKHRGIMASKKSTKAPTPPTKALSDKLKKAGAKGVLESKLLGSKSPAALKDALAELERDRLVVKLNVPGDSFCFAPEHVPLPVAEHLVHECKARGNALWKPADILKKLPKYYSAREAEESLQALCNGPDVATLKDGKNLKHVYLPGVRISGGDYFVSEAARWIYALVELDGDNQQRALGLTPTHYRDADRARSWHRQVAKVIHPDISHHPKAHEATDQLDRIYRRMTDT